MKYFFTSDWHFGCDDIIKRENRPFKNIEENEEYVINDINSRCGKEDKLYVVGDMITYNDNIKIDIKDIESVIKRINTKIVLIMGNNEQRLMRDRYNNDIRQFREECKKIGIETVREDDYISFGDRIFYINHYPRNQKEIYVNLFGHTHRVTGLYKEKGLNVGTDLNHFRVYSEEDILYLLSEKEKYWEVSIDVLVK